MAFAATLALTALAAPPPARTRSSCSCTAQRNSNSPATTRRCGRIYKEAGLEVEIRPGAGREQTPIDPVRELTEGRANSAPAAPSW